MENELISLVNKLYKRGDYQYVLHKYADRNYWSHMISKQNPSVNVDNMTDFNYSTCYTLFVHSAPTSRLSIGNEEFAEYLRANGCLNGVLLQISAIAPYAAIKYWRYEKKQYDTSLQESFMPFDHHSELFGKWVSDVLAEHNITILDQKVLEIEVPGISLELREEHVTVYHCLFEDSY